ncbi:GIY-YIG nuclease family protein [Candidatus Uhrbacteria bacterium]|nr:GIY-YIG nuclease family protein [Candidatus Uhrbacteria bacterium]
MFYVYVLQSARLKKLYIGFTTDLRKRFNEHNRGKSVATKPYRPWTLIYYEASLNEQDARRREAYLKTTQGYRLLQRRLKEYLYHQR